MASVLDNIKTAVALLDADAPDFPETALEVEEFFRKRGISLSLKAVHRRSWIFANPDVDFFLSLLPEKNWHLEFNVRRSKAGMKAGRFQIGDCFDLVLSSSPEAPSTQLDIFRRMIQIMEKIK